MRTIPGRLLTESVTIRAYLGATAAGPQFGAAVTARAHIQAVGELAAADRGGLVGSARAATTTDGWRIWLRVGPTITVGSRITARGQDMTAVKVIDHDGRGLPVPSHIELRCELTGFLADTTVTILRGTPTQNAFLDWVDVDTVVASGIAAAIVEEKQTSSEPADQRGGVVEVYNIRLRSTADVREGDRIRDDRTSHTYVVLEVTFPHTTTGPELGTDDVTAVCRRIAPTSTPPS